VGGDVSALAELAERLDLALLSGAMLPFDTAADITWAPKPRIPLMLEHFAREVGPASEGWAAMSQILTVQTTIDYLNEADLLRKHRMTNAVSPLVAALFVNSPMRASELTGRQSVRMLIWEGVDGQRVGIPEHALATHSVVDKLIDWLGGQLMIFRVVDGQPAPAPAGVPFRDLLVEGYGDGTHPTMDDWRSLLATTWPYVRLRETLELRVADGPNQADWPAAPALWVGLAYDEASCAAAMDLMSAYTLDDHRAAILDVADRGLDATIGGTSVRALSEDLLRIAQDGLARRVKVGLETEDVLSYLDPLREVLDCRVTRAEQLAADWVGRFARDPARYVEEYRYR
jgi:glutamate--cysteine ligase